jgi:hypothetical protein
LEASKGLPWTNTVSLSDSKEPGMSEWSENIVKAIIDANMLITLRRKSGRLVVEQ